MASLIAQKAGLSILEKHMQNYEPTDPLYETYTDDKGKSKRRKRDLPPGLSARDAKILRKVKQRAYRLDKGFSICGLRFGWTFIIGFIPMAGDVTNAVLNYKLVVKKAKEADLPDWLVYRMLLNNAVSGGVGLIPIVGDIFVLTFKTNSRNALLLEEYLAIRGEEYLKAAARRAERLAASGQNAGPQPAESTSGRRWGTISGMLSFRKGKKTPVDEPGASEPSVSATLPQETQPEEPPLPQETS